MNGTQTLISICLVLLGILISAVPGCLFAVKYYKQSKAVKVYVVIHFIVIIILLIFLISQSPTEVIQYMQ